MTVPLVARGSTDDGAGAAGGRRAVTLLAVGAVLLTTPALWSAATAVAPPTLHGLGADPRVHDVLLVGAVLATAVLLAAGLVAGLTRSSRALVAVDAAVLAVGSGVVLGLLLLSRSVSDEGVLVGRAATALLSGQHVYGAEWRSLFVDPVVALTPTMAGSADYTFGYPPGSVLLVAGLRSLVGHASIAPALAATGALVLGVVAAWLLAPAPWRSLVTVAGLATPMLPADARDGYPAVIALALLVPAVAGWHRTGSGGALGRWGVARAVAVGAACAVHQTAWFVTAFLVVGVWALRREEVGAVRALLLAARSAFVAFAVWALVDLPFAVQQPQAWLEGILLPITQHAIVHGQGLVALIEFLLPGSGAIGWLGFAQLALLLALLVLLALFPRRLAPALPVLAAIPYFVGTRSSADYFVLFLPLWVLCAVTVPAVPGAPEGRILRLGRRGVALVVAALLVPALACAIVAVATPSPLTVRIAAVAVSGRAVQHATLSIRNEGGSPVRPHFLSRLGTHPSFWWRVRSGPAELAPGASATYVITPDSRSSARAVARSWRSAVLMTVSDAPQTLTTTRFPG
ncbi:hypothetical protein [Amnibacterium kyonggiense]